MMMTLLQGADAAANYDDISAVVELLVKAVQEQQWGVLAAAIMMALVWIATKLPLLRDVLKGATALWVSAIASVVSALAVGYLTSNSWLTATVAALTAAAGGSLVALISRAVSGKPIEDKDNDGKLDPIEPEPATGGAE